VKISAVKSHTLTGGRGAKMNFRPYLPRVFFDMKPNVMLLSVGEFRENQFSKKPYLNWGGGAKMNFYLYLPRVFFDMEPLCNAVERWGVS